MRCCHSGWLKPSIPWVMLRASFSLGLLANFWHGAHLCTRIGTTFFDHFLSSTVSILTMGQ
uniref:Uncharacterized protein n=1 Tax=Anguilla anguilla TaxID=7936 RepID=A0A0E9QS16_ANGAN